jgi:hypothetical protein
MYPRDDEYYKSDIFGRCPECGHIRQLSFYAINDPCWSCKNSQCDYTRKGDWVEFELLTKFEVRMIQAAEKER